MTMTPAPEGCSPAHGGCTCPCHRTPGMFHLVACCRQVVGPDPVPLAEGQDEIPPKRYGVTGSLGASHPHLADYILVDETGEGIWVMHAEWAMMKQERDQLKQQLAQETAAYTRMQGAATNIPSELDVRKVVIGVEHGPRGRAIDVYAKNVAEVHEHIDAQDEHISEADVLSVIRNNRIAELMKERDDAVAKLNDALKANQELTQYITTAKDNGREVMERQAAMAPVPITIQCPKCAHWHVDEDKEVPHTQDTVIPAPGAGMVGVRIGSELVTRNWAKHPHSTHRCAHCNHTWNPFPIKMPTVGVMPFGKAADDDAFDKLARQRDEARKERDEARDELRDALADNSDSLGNTVEAEDDAWSTAAAEQARKLGAEIGELKAELEKALAGPWRPDLRKELDAALAEIVVLKKDANDAHAILTKHLVVRKWFPNGSEGAGVDRGIYERVQDMAIMLGNERADADRIRRERDDAKAEAKMYMDRDNGENKALLKERDEALQGKAHTASDCDMARRERDVALQQRDEARELCRSAKGDVTTLRGLCKDLENKIQAMVQANAASAWGIAERDKMMKERDAALHQEEIALAALRALRKEADVFEADRDRLKSELAMPVGPDRLIDVNGDLLTVGEFVRDVQEEIRIRERAEADRDRFKQERDEARAAHQHAVSQFDAMAAHYKTACEERQKYNVEMHAVRAERDEARTAWDNMAKEVRERTVACENLSLELAQAKEEYTKRGHVNAELLKERDEARKEIDAMNMRGMSDPIQLLISERDMARVERDETRRLVNDVCTKLAVPMMSTHDRVQRLADWYLAVRDEHESLVKERDQIREGYRELNSRHVALVEHWAPLKGSASEQALPDGAKGEIRPGEGAFGTTLRPRGAGEDELRRRLEERERILTEIDTLAANAGANHRQGTLQKVRWLVSELGQFKGMYEKVCKEVEVENWAVLQALQQPGVIQSAAWTAMTRLQRIQALVRDRDAWRRIAQVCGYKGKDDLRIVPKPGPGQGAIGTTPYPPRNPDPIGGYGHPEGLTILECQSETLAILVHLHLAGSGWSTDRDLEDALAEWCQVRYDRAKGMIKRGPAMDLLTKAVDAWCAQKVKGTK